jgi:hypothetical protein
MQNIKFSYLYRDYGNNKVHGEVIFSNPENLSPEFIAAELKKRFMDEIWFIPSLMKIPHLFFEDYAYDPELDHPYNEFSGIEGADEKATDGRDVSELIKSDVENYWWRT